MHDVFVRIYVIKNALGCGHVFSPFILCARQEGRESEKHRTRDRALHAFESRLERGTGDSSLTRLQSRQWLGIALSPLSKLPTFTHVTSFRKERERGRERERGGEGGRRGGGERERGRERERERDEMIPRLDFRRLPGPVLILPEERGWVRAHFPEQRLVIEPRWYPSSWTFTDEGQSPKNLSCLFGFFSWFVVGSVCV